MSDQEPRNVCQMPHNLTHACATLYLANLIWVSGCVNRTSVICAPTHDLDLAFSDVVILC